MMTSNMNISKNRRQLCRFWSINIFIHTNGYSYLLRRIGSRSFSQSRIFDADYATDRCHLSHHIYSEGGDCCTATDPWPLPLHSLTTCLTRRTIAAWRKFSTPFHLFELCFPIVSSVECLSCPDNHIISQNGEWEYKLMKTNRLKIKRLETK